MTFPIDEGGCIPLVLFFRSTQRLIHALTYSLVRHPSFAVCSPSLAVIRPITSIFISGNLIIIGTIFDDEGRSNLDSSFIFQ